MEVLLRYWKNTLKHRHPTYLIWIGKGLYFVSAPKVLFYLWMLLDQGETVKENKAEDSCWNTETEHAGHTLQKHTATSRKKT